MDLGDKIKSARTQKGITQKELAEITGLTERTIQRIENHEVEPSVYSLNKISEILSFDFQTEKMRIMKRRNQIIYTVMIVWTIALAFNLFFTEFSFDNRWWEIVIWFMTLVFVVTGQIYIPYRRRK
ncbi:helix-turn-helix transcriptional regulator [Lacinutrix sp.]|uniref:helix-turn-helix domain-containing protein n=1 Tax=Lacinutrix sp. TaxID=1937692 RepID=UPI00262E2341|nr:helix-turn-helix transcriptional regulator [Lacinutrix sp.]MDG1714509.1 helix-turn-helix transcriptional regulator [Lacinutrix sp.]